MTRCDKDGGRRIRMHDTRRTCTSLLAALDVHRVAMAILWHAQISITMEVYNNSRELHQVRLKPERLRCQLVLVSLRGRRAGVKIGTGCPPTPVPPRVRCRLHG